MENRCLAKVTENKPSNIILMLKKKKYYIYCRIF